MAGQLQTGYNFYQPAHTQPILMNTKCLNNYKNLRSNSGIQLHRLYPSGFLPSCCESLSMQQINDHIEILFLNPEVPDL